MLPIDDQKSLRATVASLGAKKAAPEKITDPAKTTPVTSAGSAGAKPGTSKGLMKTRPGTSKGPEKTGSGTSAGTTKTVFDPLPVGPSTTLAATTRDGSHHGSRDKSINELESQIKSISTKQNLINVLPHAMPAIGILGKFVLDKVMGDGMNKEIEKKKAELATNKTLNFMAETLYALGAPQSAVNALDGAQKVNVVADKSLPSDAEFDSKTNAVNVSKSMVDKVAVDQAQLLKQGIIDGEGNVIDKNRLNASPLKENTVKVASLVGSHEATHATQKATGVVDRFNHINDTLRGSILGSAKSTDAPTLAKLKGAADTASNLLRDRMLEYDAYHNQELIQKAAGAPGKVHVTIDRSGASLPLTQAVANITAFETDTALPYGPDKGVKKSDASHNQIATDNLPGGRFPGGRFPGDVV